jgi:lipopolysaccharide/colanic/teichoic acid biosynthesis glycosyltransferase
MRARQAEPQTGWPFVVKSLMDRSLAFAALGLSAPLLGPVALGVWLTMGRPILFIQERPGRWGRPFKLIKFRTMRPARQGEGVATDGDRLTAFGRFMRGFSLDELPQLINVLKGDMSLVGPRPLLMQYLPLYSPSQARRHEVMPGITGLAQVNGRNATTWEERLRLDVEYVANWSLSLDLRILLQTLHRVVARTGVSNEGHATMPEFKGSAGSDGLP